MGRTFSRLTFGTRLAITNADRRMHFAWVNRKVFLSLANNSRILSTNSSDACRLNFKIDEL
jgi:hypothetical protein